MWKISKLVGLVLGATSLLCGVQTAAAQGNDNAGSCGRRLHKKGYQRTKKNRTDMPGKKILIDTLQYRRLADGRKPGLHDP